MIIFMSKVLSENFAIPESAVSRIHTFQFPESACESRRFFGDG